MHSYLIKRPVFSDSTSQDVDIELDQEFLHELRGVKILTSDQKIMEKHKYLTSKRVKSRLHSVSRPITNSSGT